MAPNGTPSVGRPAGLLSVEDYQDAQQFRSVSEALRLLAITKNNVDLEVESVSDGLLKEIALNIMDSHTVKVDDVQAKLKQKLQPVVDKQSAVEWVFTRFKKHFENSLGFVKSKNPAIAQQVLENMIKEFTDNFKEIDCLRQELQCDLNEIKSGTPPVQTGGANLNLPQNSVSEVTITGPDSFRIRTSKKVSE